MKQLIEICGQATNKALLMNLAPNPDDAVSLLTRMVEESALVTHPRGNRRYGTFILKVVCNQLQNLYLDSPKNDWCRVCFDTGIVRVYDVEQGVTRIPCQICRNKGVGSERHDAISTRQPENRDSRWAV
jgi:hypothetical protein